MIPVKKGLDAVLKWACVILFAALVLIVIWQVVTRLAGSPSSWAEEGARFTFVWLGFMASALVFSEKGHIAVDFLVRRQKEAGQKRTAVLAQVAVMAFAILVLIWGGVRASIRAWGQGLSSLPGTMGMMYTVMPFTGALIVFYAWYQTIEIVRGVEPPYQLDEAEQQALAQVEEAEAEQASVEEEEH